MEKVLGVNQKVAESTYSIMENAQHMWAFQQDVSKMKKHKWLIEICRTLRKTDAPVLTYLKYLLVAY